MNKEELKDIICQSSSDYEILNEAYNYIEKLEQKNKNLKFYKQENKQLKDNWNKLKKWINSNDKHFSGAIPFRQTLKEMQELEKDIPEQTKEQEYKIGDIVNYNNFEWYIIDIKEDSYTLLMKERMPKELIKEIFTDKSMLDDDFDIIFSRNEENIWWSDSYIRQVLNTKFLEKFNVEELNEMETAVSLSDEISTTKDYIRLITKEEYNKLDINILEVNDDYGYWIMSPYNFHGTNTNGWVVASADIIYSVNVYNASGIRPVINLKSDVLKNEGLYERKDN